jgi:hypothetical protein
MASLVRLCGLSLVLLSCRLAEREVKMGHKGAGPYSTIRLAPISRQSLDELKSAGGSDKLDAPR